jgi:signal transduction histidine kinase
MRRLAASTVAVADGQYHHRVPVSGSDEISHLESGFNRMAERLTHAMAAERHLASAGERARIARELHDSISQDLFSLRLLAGGLRRALPSESPLHHQVEAMERTATGTMHEMQALLRELRPVALQDAGLIATAARAVPGAANAVKHARPTLITVLMRRLDGQLVVQITDNGAGFDPARAAQRHGMGLGLMRERVAELGGTVLIESTPGEGTSVRAVIRADVLPSAEAL